MKERGETRTHFRTLELPGDASHDVHGVGTTHSDADAAEATAVWCVRICTDQHDSRIGVVLQDDLQNYTICLLKYNEYS